MNWQTLYDFLTDTTFSVPIVQVAVFVVIISLCMLLGRDRLGLLITYAFVFFWGFVLNFQNFVTELTPVSGGLYLYALSGLVMMILLILGVFWKPE